MILPEKIVFSDTETISSLLEERAFKAVSVHINDKIWLKILANEGGEEFNVYVTHDDDGFIFMDNGETFEDIKKRGETKNIEEYNNILYRKVENKNGAQFVNEFYEFIYDFVYAKKGLIKE